MYLGNEYIQSRVTYLLIYIFRFYKWPAPTSGTKILSSHT